MKQVKLKQSIQCHASLNETLNWNQILLVDDEDTSLVLEIPTTDGSPLPTEVFSFQ